MEKIGFYYKTAIKLQTGINDINICDKHILHFDERSKVEEMNNAVQPVCAGILLTKSGKILTFRKSDKNVGKENSPEKRKTLLYVGGHLDKVDKDFSNTTALLNGTRREIKEELGIDIYMNCDAYLKSYIIYQQTDLKTSQHFGAMHTILLEEEFEPKFIDGRAQFVDIDKAKQIPDLKDWSKYIIDEIIK